MSHDRPRWWRVARVSVRRLLARVDRTAPAWLTWLPSWGTSLLFHAVLIVILALVAYVGQAREKRPDIDGSIVSLADSGFTSVQPADQSGDPFTKEKSKEQPSIAIDPTGTGISQPDFAGAQFTPSLSMPDRSSTSKDGSLTDSVRSMKVHTEDMTAPFSGRSGQTRAQLVRREGGTQASEKAVEYGLHWLMRHQRDDGGWSLDTRAECRTQPGCPDDGIRPESDTAATGLALLPFLGAGHIHTQPSRYQDQVKRGIDWLLSNQKKDGQLFLGGLFNSAMYSHAIATMALCEAYGISKDPRLKEPAQLAINYIVACQNKDDGGWRYTPGMPGDTSVFGWQMFAFRSARLGGLNVPKNAIKGCAHYLDLASCDKHRTTYSYLPGRDSDPVMTAQGLLCRQYLGWPRDYPYLLQGVATVWTDLEVTQQRNIYYWYYATQLLHNMQNKQWKLWNVKVRDTLINMQIGGEGCDRGSWSPAFPTVDRWGRTGGRLFQTSLSILTLEVYYRFLPLYRNTDATSEEMPKL